ncbi:TPA: hypothetical protein ACH3X1_013337 [Trebouxia sp. C0004]
MASSSAAGSKLAELEEKLKGLEEQKAAELKQERGTRDLELLVELNKDLDRVQAAIIALSSGAGAQEVSVEIRNALQALPDLLRFMRLVLRGQLRPTSSSASTKRLEDYRRAAIEHYYGSHADLSKIRCMVTGEEVDSKQITAGHIYRQGWPTGLLKVMGCRLHDPCNIVLMQKQLEKRFDNWEWTIIPEGSELFRVHVLNPHLLDLRGLEQYISGHAGRGTKWKDIDKTHLHLPPLAHPARRMCGLHAMLAVQEADSKGWFDGEHEAPMVSEASWESPTFDHQLMNKFLSDTSTADKSS